MNFRTILTITTLLSAITPCTLHAEVHKCVSATGAVSFVDHPCKDGEKPGELKDSVTSAAMAAQDNGKKLNRACSALMTRQTQCYASIEPTMLSIFRENCTTPAAHFERDNNRELMRNQGRNNGDADYNDRYQRKTKDELQCDVLQADLWKFTKENFGKKISEKDMKAIEYHLAAVPSDGREIEAFKKKRR